MGYFVSSKNQVQLSLIRSQKSGQEQGSKTLVLKSAKVPVLKTLFLITHAVLKNTPPYKYKGVLLFYEHRQSPNPLDPF